MKAFAQKEIPWNIYPRPLCKRDSFLCLNGEWEFATSRRDEVPTAFPERILVPFPPESRLSGSSHKYDKRERLFYRHRFSVPRGFCQDKTVLHFGAIDGEADIILNGQAVYRHEGGYLPLSVDVTAYLAEENELVVCVRDRLDHTLPYGKQRIKRGGMWYTPVSGIWQTVWLESFPTDGIEGISVRSDTRSATITVQAEAEAILRYFDGEEQTIPFRGSVTVTPKDGRLWSPEDPYLYRFTVETATDRAESYFALRALTVERVGDMPRLALNGKPYFFHGLLDQGYFEDGIYLPRSPEEYERDILRAREMGFNMLRKHIKVEPAAFYEACDRLGMVVFQDAVNNGCYSFLWHTALPTVGMKRCSPLFQWKSRAARRVFREHTDRTIAHLVSYPSVLYFTIFNEAWGQADGATLYRLYKEKYPHLILDTASGWFIERQTDVRSDHVYFKPVRANYTGSDKPIVLSEFGGYSLRVDGHLFNLKRNYGYRTLKTAEELTEAIAELYRSEIVPAIEKGLSASVYTQISDVEDETNGLITYDREVIKVDIAEMQEIAKQLNEALSRATERKP